MVQQAKIMEPQKTFIIRIELPDGNTKKKGITACTENHAIDKLYYQFGYHKIQEDRSKYKKI